VDVPEGGKIARFGIDTKQFTFYDLPKEAGVPVGIVEDKEGQLWVNDHASNLFFYIRSYHTAFCKILYISSNFQRKYNHPAILEYYEG
jgi:streptogramin lyase